MPWNLCEKDLHNFCDPVLGDRNEGLKFFHSIATVFNQMKMKSSCLGPFRTNMFAELLRKEEGIFESHFIYKFNERLLFSKVCAGIYRKTLKKGKLCFCKPWVSYIYWQVYDSQDLTSRDSQGLRRSSTDPVAMKSIEVDETLAGMAWECPGWTWSIWQIL